MVVFEGFLKNVRPDLRHQTGSKVGKLIMKKLRNGLNFVPQNFQLDTGTPLDARTQSPFFFCAFFWSRSQNRVIYDGYSNHAHVG